MTKFVDFLIDFGICLMLAFVLCMIFEPEAVGRTLLAILNRMSALLPG